MEYDELVSIDIETITKEIDNRLGFLSIDPNGKRKNLTNIKREELNKTLKKSKSQLLRLSNEIEKLSISDNTHVYEDKIYEQNEKILELEKENLNLKSNITNLSEKINVLENELKEKNNLTLQNEELKNIYQKISDLLKIINK